MVFLVIGAFKLAKPPVLIFIEYLFRIFSLLTVRVTPTFLYRPPACGSKMAKVAKMTKETR